MGRRYTASLFAPATTAPIVYPRIKVSWLCHPDAYSVLLPDGAVLHLGREARVWIDLSRSYVTVAMIGPMAWSDYGPWLSDPDVRLGMELIGAAVKRRRRQNYLSQTKLGQMTGIPQSTISR